MANPFPVTNPERIPAKRYYDQAFYEAEKERLWPNVWQMAAGSNCCRMSATASNIPTWASR